MHVLLAPSAMKGVLSDYGEVANSAEVCGGTGVRTLP